MGRNAFKEDMNTSTPMLAQPFVSLMNKMQENPIKIRSCTIYLVGLTCCTEFLAVSRISIDLKLMSRLIDSCKIYFGNFYITTNTTKKDAFIAGPIP